MAQSKRDFLDFLDDTLIPDLRESGRTAPASDLRLCVSMARAGKKGAKAAAFFRRAASDYRASGSTSMAKDYARCARLVSPRSKR